MTMTDDKCREVLDIYAVELQDYEDGPLGHCKEMIPKMDVFIDEGRREKFFRWLGFLQGVLWMEGMYTLEELKDHNRPDPDPSIIKVL